MRERILCFDIGNTDVYAGVFCGRELELEFRTSNRARPTVDEFGVFLLQVLQVRGIEIESIVNVAIASVVPDVLPTVVQACEKYLGKRALVLQAGVKTGLKIRMKDPREVGADRIANAMAAVEAYPGENLIVVDMGTATTFCAVSAQKEYLGGAISTGVGLSMNALATQTAKLPRVDIVRPERALGKTTVENMQSGLYWGQVGLLKEIIGRLSKEAFGDEPVRVIGTGGMARLFGQEAIFDVQKPALVLEGLLTAIKLNP